MFEVFSKGPGLSDNAVSEFNPIFQTTLLAELFPVEHSFTTFPLQTLKAVIYVAVDPPTASPPDPVLRPESPFAYCSASRREE